MSRYLMIDFGSTFTKLTAVDTEIEDIMGTASHFTTVETDICIGYHNALNELYKKIGKVEFDDIIACSSAAGGLKMAAIGLIEELTVEAAKRVCLGAGAKVELVLSHHLTHHELDEITNKKIDIILLAGGIDGGNSECALYNAKLIGEAGLKIPVIFAGNKCLQDDIINIFSQYQINGYICENVMPRINVLNPQNAKEKIREIFLKNIIVAKGIKKIENEIDQVILPTPEAVLLASDLLSRGYLYEEGLGEIVVIDIGGATTDLYSLCSPSARRGDVIIKGLEETYAKRTVEGDLGMRYSALGVYESLSKEEIEHFKIYQNIDIEKAAKYRRSKVGLIFTDPKEQKIDRLFASICADKAMHRHAGQMEEVYTAMGKVYHQTGKDLTQVAYIIGTGGILVNSVSPVDILQKATANHQTVLELRPINPKFIIDRDYILASMGLLSQIDPLLALKIMKKHLKIIER